MIHKKYLIIFPSEKKISVQQEKDVIIYYLASVVVSSNTYRANVLEALQFIQEAFTLPLKGTCIVNLPNIPLPIII